MARVLVVTGGFLTAAETSVWRALRKQAMQWRRSDGAWLDLQVKAVAAEPIAAIQRERRRAGRRDPAVERFFACPAWGETPELTEALLATLLRAEGIPYDLASFDEVFAGGPAIDAKLSACDCVFLSATMLRDETELGLVLDFVRRPHHRVVVGGALAGALPHDWDGMEGIDVLAVGYGESLVPALAQWIRGGYASLPVPQGGRLRATGPTQVLHGGLPEGTSLDHLPVADWALSERDHGRPFRLIHYESVRGCPYRCMFCNYPFLFDDTKFRMRSARRMADDWQAYQRELGVDVINCLDSLFTMPKRRLLEFCDLLVERGVRVRWVCYARADDLADEETVVRMRRAGAALVHVGIESGDQGQLDRMNKRCTVEGNAAALRNCRRHGLTSLASLVVGYPGETAQTVERTVDFLRATPPDFHFLAVFNTRIQAVPVLQPEARARFGLRTAAGAGTGAPYWRHASMDCAEATRHARAMERALITERVSLSAAPFYAGILDFDPAERGALLDFQARALAARPILGAAFGALHRWSTRRLRADMARRPEFAQAVAA